MAEAAADEAAVSARPRDATASAQRSQAGWFARGLIHHTAAPELRNDST
jgi:hypothetical protein